MKVEVHSLGKMWVKAHYLLLKFEIRISKSETISNIQKDVTQTLWGIGVLGSFQLFRILRN